MNYQELEKIFGYLSTIPDSKREKAFETLMRLSGFDETENQSQSKEEVSKDNSFNDRTVEETSDTTTLLKLKTKEISKMPTRFKKELLINDRTVRCRKRQSGRHTYNYELRYRRNGISIQVSSNNLDVAIQKFIAATWEYEKRKQEQEAIRSEDGTIVPEVFDAFSIFYFEKYRKRKVSKITYDNDMYRYKKHLRPLFGDKLVKDITSIQCQSLLDDLLARGMSKTNNEIYSMLNGIFKMAVAHGIIEKNPMAIVIIEKHQRQHGTALTKDEEKVLLAGVKNSRSELCIAVALYTGLRPNELETAKVSGKFIVAVNSKRKGGKVEYKKIPITKMLKPYLKGVNEITGPSLKCIRKDFNQVLPNHIFYDLRTTFYTRCEECGVAPPARDHFVGHSSGVLNNTYTDLSDEYLLKEGEKLYW